MNESEFEFNGKVYVSVESNLCDGCAFNGVGHECVRPADSSVPYCARPNRDDGKWVIFVEKQQ